MNRTCAVRLGSMLLVLAALGASAPAATAVAPAGYSPSSPAGSEYREQLASGREIGARNGGRLADGSAREDGSLFGAGITPKGGVGTSRVGTGDGDATAPGRDGGSPALAADASERSAIAAAARAPLDGPSPSLITGLLVVGALVATGMLSLLLRGRAAPGP